MAFYGIAKPHLLELATQKGISYGADQNWFYDAWQKRAGCGPTTLSHLLWYLSKTRPSLRALCEYDKAEQSAFTYFMQEVWTYVTPTKMGLNKTSLMQEGALRYAADKGCSLNVEILDIPPFPLQRPDQKQLLDFLVSAFKKDVPIAFLNLSNGALQNLDSWHWVTLTQIESNTLTAQMLDAGKKQEIDLALWLSTSTLGGGFVQIY